MLAHLGRRAAALGLGARVTAHAGEVATLPGTEPFDAATRLLVLHFLADDGAKRALLGDVAARLRPGAPLLLADTAGDPDSAEYALLFGAWEAHLRRAAGATHEAAAKAAAAVRAGIHPVGEGRLAALRLSGRTPNAPVDSPRRLRSMGSIGSIGLGGRFADACCHTDVSISKILEPPLARRGLGRSMASAVDRTPSPAYQGGRRDRVSDEAARASPRATGRYPHQSLAGRLRRGGVSGAVTPESVGGRRLGLRPVAEC